MDKGLEQTITEKAGLLNTIVARKFGSNPDAAATSGEETQTGGGHTMKVTRSASSGAPGEVQDGKLVNMKALAAAAARNDVPPTDLLALARQNDPHNEETIPATIAGAVTASDRGLPGQELAEDNSMKELGDIEKERKDSLHQKQHGPIEKAVNTDVKSQVSDSDPYKSLQAGAEIDQIVARAKAVVNGADQIRALAATEITDHPGAGKVEGNPVAPVAKGEDAGKNAPDSAKTLSATTSRKDVLSAIRAEVTQRRAKVEGALEDPVPGGSDAAKTPEESAKTLGDGGSKKGSVQAPAKVAESKDRPLASMPEGKPRYKADGDNRDEEAASYWKKNKADESRFDKEPAADRPITREVQDKMPKLAPKASRRQELLTRLAGLRTILVAGEDEAARLHLKKQTYKQDKAEDMDYGGAAGRTKSEINKEHGQRSSDSGTLSPMMSRLWSAYGPVKTAADKGYKGDLEKGETKTEMKKQIEEMKTALKGLKSEDAGADSQMDAMHSKIEKMESELAKASGIHSGTKSTSALATAQDRLAVIAAALGDIHRLCQASHIEVRFALEKPHGTGVSDDMGKLLEDLGETVLDMEGAIDMALKDMGHPGLKHHPEPDGDEEGAPKGPPEADLAEELPGAGAEPEMPAGLDLGAGSKGRVKTAFEAEDEAVEKAAADSKLSPEEKKAKVAELRAGSKWTAEFSKVASKDDSSKADMLSSYWQVVRNGEPVLKVSLNQAYPVKTAKEQAEAFAWFATKDYGRKLLSSAKFEGLGRTAKLMGVSPMVKGAAGKINPKTYYSEAFGSEYATELLKNHEKKAAADRAVLEEKIAALESEKKAQQDRNDRLQKDIEMRAKAARALGLAQKAMSKGMISTEHKASFIDSLMLGDDQAFKIANTMVENFKPVAAAPEVEERKAGLTAKDLLKIASAGPGLKTAIVTQAKASGPFAGLSDQLQDIWRKPPTAQ